MYKKLKESANDLHENDVYFELTVNANGMIAAMDTYIETHKELQEKYKTTVAKLSQDVVLLKPLIEAAQLTSLNELLAINKQQLAKNVMVNTIMYNIDEENITPTDEITKDNMFDYLSNMHDNPYVGKAIEDMLSYTVYQDFRNETFSTFVDFVTNIVTTLHEQYLDA